MEEQELKDQLKDQKKNSGAFHEPEHLVFKPKDNITMQQKDTASCPTCGGGMTSSADSPAFIYAIGKVEVRFPTLEIEKEFTQTQDWKNTKSHSDSHTLHTVLSQKHNRYLLRHLCWVMNIAGLPTYILMARDPADYDLLLETIRPRPSPSDIDIVIGFRGPIARPEMCSGLQIPIAIIDQMYSFPSDSLLRSIPKPDGVLARDFAPAAQQIFDMIIQMTDNAGSANEHRALNYLAVRDPNIYSTAANAFKIKASLSGVEVRQSTLSSLRNILKVIFSYTNRQTGVVDKYSVDVDVTGMYPFLVKNLSPFFDH